MAENKRSLSELFKPSREVRETIPAGSNYEPGKSAIQFYGMVEKEFKNRLELANATIAEYRKMGYDTQINEAGKLEMGIPDLDDINALIKQMVDTVEYLAAIRESKQTTNALILLAEIKQYEENHTNKKGLAELRGIITASDVLTAAALTEESR